MRIVKTVGELEGAGLAQSVFVPTMGALHEGHIALVRAAADIRVRRAIRGPVVVSIFVNPTQFNDRNDLARYPRTLEADVGLCADAGADVVFAPDESSIYPPGELIRTPPLPKVATEPGLEDALRPGHFAGVCQVVARLFSLVRPRLAVFGEKDWQQLQVIREMVRSGEGLDPAARPEILGVSTVREPDGLAMSSRNVFLTPEERLRAAAIYRALRSVATESLADAAERAMAAAVTRSGLTLQYAVVRDAESLLVPGVRRPCRALIAAKLGSVRLIDNAPWPWTA